MNHSSTDSAVPFQESYSFWRNLAIWIGNEIRRCIVSVIDDGREAEEAGQDEE